MHFKAMKRIKLILFFVLTLASFSVKSQIAFFKAYSDNGYDKGEGIVQLQDSSYLVTGSSSSFNSSSQAFILKVDSLGNRLWSKNFGGAETEKGRRIFHVPNDGIYVVGQTNSYAYKFYDAYFFKTDDVGNLLYEKNYGGTGFEDIHDGVMLADTSFIFVGETHSTVTEVENLYLLRVNKFGDTLWTKNFGSEGKDIARSIKLLNDTTVIIAGEYYVSDSLTQKAMFIKMHIDGTVEWLKTYGEKGKYVLNDLSIDNNEIRGVGYNQMDLNVVGNNKQCMLKIDVLGNLVSLKSEEHLGDFSFECIVKYGVDFNDYYFVSKIENSPDIPTYANGTDIMIYRFDYNMNYNNAAFFPSETGNDVPNEIISTSDKGAILVGYNENNENGGNSITLMKIGRNDLYPFSQTEPIYSTLVSILDLDKNSKISIFPNPVEKEINLSGIKFIDCTISILNQLGDEVLKSDSFKEKIDVTLLKSGLYFLCVENNQTKEIIKFIKK